VGKSLFLPDLEGFGVDDCRLHDLLAFKDAPSDCIDLMLLSRGELVPVLVDSFIRNVGVGLEVLDEEWENAGMDEELNVGLLVDEAVLRAPTVDGGGGRLAIDSGL